ncbi:GNAT family N-acetyltransferase [Achromobacter xylosoxidans]|uniref:GNAT family N-acetyltransferase n=1 Tax=Alcaligenes xylosoxydans xylosoxydans TaxID=85698 RepID=A0A424WHE8_ALCXX|nr:GNAT family N-acetyltransferase [Achromobacter xylosoxidans]MBC9902851.1 GNAT family N-acetyltransferase [Achromobacter xylosoxidans]MBD0868547.1 GNAT family N-acetyltransferase [Achromobacter xylosoxidans]QNP83270.1 GNAT family N-acetyltransferase [Achromobacter xylosoxidans]RPJ92698.1 GNAT family N-acetyltransferase [Achromobacter xylosoxidans]
MSFQTQVRIAQSVDIDSIVELDPIARQEPGRRTFIAQAVAAGQCWAATAAEDASALVGYGVLDRSFFGHDFIPLIVVKRSARRRGVATAIMRTLELQCQGGKLFTSTNRSNIAMRQLLGRLGFIRSGQIENLDDGDPELVFVKLRSSL